MHMCPLAHTLWAHLANTTRILHSSDDHLPGSLLAITCLHWWPSSKESDMKYPVFRKSLGKCTYNRKHFDLAAGKHLAAYSAPRVSS